MFGGGDLKQSADMNVLGSNNITTSVSGAAAVKPYAARTVGDEAGRNAYWF